MACMCGDYYCGSCGPAQGNYHCLVCGMWSADGGCEDRQKCREENERLAEAENQAAEQLGKDAADYWASHPEES